MLSRPCSARRRYAKRLTNMTRLADASDRLIHENNCMRRVMITAASILRVQIQMNVSARIKCVNLYFSVASSLTRRLFASFSRLFISIIVWYLITESMLRTSSVINGTIVSNQRIKLLSRPCKSWSRK